MELDKSDDVRKRRPKGDDVDYSPSSDDERWEKAKNKPGNESLEPRRISVPLPGSEAQALTPAYRKMIKRLDDKVELYKLHVKHYHMSPTQFRRRTSMLDLPSSAGAELDLDFPAFSSGEECSGLTSSLGSEILAGLLEDLT